MRTKRPSGMAAIFATLAIAMTCSIVHADVITIDTDVDTYVEQKYPSNNGGGHTWLQVFSHNTQDYSDRNALVWFELPANLVGGTITSATLKVQGRSVSTNCQVGVRRMLQSWTEGTGIGTATGDGATWNTYDGTNAWPGGTPFVDSVIDTGSIMTPGTATPYNTLGPIYELDVTDTVTAWADGADNYGMLIQIVNAAAGISQSFSLASSESTDGGVGPQLVIDYLPVPEPMTLGLLGIGGLGMMIRRQRV